MIHVNKDTVERQLSELLGTEVVWKFELFG